MTETGTTAVIGAGPDRGRPGSTGQPALPKGKGRPTTFLIASAAYVAATLAGAFVVEVVEAIRDQHYSFRLDRLGNGVIIIGSLTLVPFLLVKGCMAESGWDGFGAHVLGAAAASAVIGLLLGSLLGAPMVNWAAVLPFLGGLGLWGAIAGAVYWIMRALLRRIVQGVAT